MRERAVHYSTFKEMILRYDPTRLDRPPGQTALDRMARAREVGPSCGLRIRRPGPHGCGGSGRADGGRKGVESSVLPLAGPLDGARRR